MNRGLLFAVCAVAATTVAPSALSARARTERHIRLNPGERLEDRIHSTDSAVTLDIDNDPPLEVLPLPGTSMAEWMTQNAKVVLLVDVNSIDGRVTAAGDSIESVVSGQIVDVLKGRGYSVGKPTSFIITGGTVDLKGVHVTAKRRWAQSFENGTQYLVFGRPLADGTVDTWEGYVLHVANDGTWERMLSTDAPQITQQLKGPDFLQEVRAAALDAK